MTCDIGISYFRAQRTTSRSCGTQVRTAAFESVPTGLTAAKVYFGISCCAFSK
jgi:hypothetical protein